MGGRFEVVREPPINIQRESAVIKVSLRLRLEGPFVNNRTGICSEERGINFIGWCNNNKNTMAV